MAGTQSGTTLPREIEEHLERYVEAFNTGDADAVNVLYTDEAVAVWEKGNPISGDARRAYVKEFFDATHPEIDATVREAYVTGDTALLVVDWTMQVDAENGGREELVGVGLDVLRRADENAAWLYAIDDPFGEEPRPAAV